VYLSGETCERYFTGLAAVILLRRHDDLAILPVHHAAAGGYLLKRRNAKGDRVVNAGDFLRFQGIVDDTDLTLAACWDSSVAGLVATGAFANAKSAELT
jgi:hypothetical protein